MKTRYTLSLDSMTSAASTPELSEQTDLSIAWRRDLFESKLLLKNHVIGSFLKSCRITGKPIYIASYYPSPQYQIGANNTNSQLVRHSKSAIKWGCKRLFGALFLLKQNCFKPTVNSKCSDSALSLERLKPDR
jgi:hypothetical protein